MVVVVLYFDNNTGDSSYDVLQKGLADMLVTDLSRAEGIEIVERDKFDQLVAELKLQRSKYFDPATAQKLGHGIGAKYAVTGSLTAFEPTLRIDVRLLEVATGRVVMADQVTGTKDQFFALEHQLAERFLRALPVTARPRLDVVADAGDLATVLQYSKGLDAADRGELETASRTFAIVAREAPHFRLAELRRQQILSRLEEASLERTAILSGNEQRLLALAEAATNVDLTSASNVAVGRALWYRAARGIVLLSKVQDAASLDVGHGMFRVVPKRRWSEAAKLLRAYLRNEMQLRDELRLCRRVRPRGDCRGRVDGEGAPLAPIEQKLKQDVWQHTDVREHEALAALAELLVRGQSLHFRPYLTPPLRPSLAQLDPAVAADATSLMDQAIAAIPAVVERKSQEEEMTKALDTYGEILLMLGRRDEAIARWQSILDRYPTGPTFAATKRKIEEALGATKEKEGVKAVMAHCSDGAMSAHMLDVSTAINFHARHAGGAREMMSDLVPLLKSCNGALTALVLLTNGFGVAAEEAVARGDCEELGVIRRRVATMSATRNTMVPMVRANIDQLSEACGP